MHIIIMHTHTYLPGYLFAFAYRVVMVDQPPRAKVNHRVSLWIKAYNNMVSQVSVSIIAAVHRCTSVRPFVTVSVLSLNFFQFLFVHRAGSSPSVVSGSWATSMVWQ